MHVSPSETCASCAEKLSGCHNSLKLWFEILADNFKDCHIAVGFRNEADQEQAFYSGRTHDHWPQSKHNRMSNGKPESWAIDIFRLGEDGKAYFEYAYFDNIWNFINKIQTQAGDQEIYWGGLFSRLKDYDHLELLKVEVNHVIEVLSQDSC